MKPGKKTRTRKLMRAFARTPRGIAAELAYRLAKTIEILCRSTLTA